MRRGLEGGRGCELGEMEWGRYGMGEVCGRWGGGGMGRNGGGGPNRHVTFMMRKNGRVA